MKLSEYVIRKNGVPFGHPKSLRNNLTRSLGAKNFATFWTFWNPIFSYFIGTKVFRPLKIIFPDAIALLMAFVFCGLIRDAVTTIARLKISLFFSVWFFIMGSLVLITKLLNYDLSNQKWIVRALVNVGIIALCFFFTHQLNAVFGFY